MTGDDGREPMMTIAGTPDDGTRQGGGGGKKNKISAYMLPCEAKMGRNTSQAASATQNRGTQVEEK